MLLKAITIILVSLLSITGISHAQETVIHDKAQQEYSSIINQAVPPTSVKTQVDLLFQDPEFVQAFIQRENTMSNKQRRIIAQKYFLQKISRWNYVFKTPLVPGYILKLGGIHWTNSFGGSSVRAKDASNKNVSRVAYQQLIAQVIQNRQLKHVCVVKKYLYEIPGNPNIPRSEKKLCDDNFIVLAQDLTDQLLTPEENYARYKTITQEQLEELNVIAREAYIADFKMMNCVFGKDDKIYLIDTEQTNRAHEDDFFLKNPEQMAKDTAWGLKWIGRLTKVRDDEKYYQTMLEVLRSSGPYYEMGIEPDDNPTVTQEFIALIEKLRESF